MKRAICALVVLSTACTGDIFTTPGGISTSGTHATPGSTPGMTGSTTPAPVCTGGCVDLSPISSITHAEYANAVLDVFGITGVRVDGLPDDGTFDGFASNAASSRSNDDATAYETIAVEVAENATALLVQECANASDVPDFVRTRAPQLLRRALTDDDVNDYVTLYQTTSTASGASHSDGVVAVVSALLQDPSFLYKVEANASDMPGSLRVLSPFELAGRLASYLWRSVPDSALINAASSGALATDDDVKAQIQRMMADPKLDRALQLFHEGWFNASGVPATSTLDPLVAADLQEEQARFVTNIVRSDKPTLEHLFTESQTPLTARLATFYGVTAPTTDWSSVAMPDRAGVLGRAFPIIANSGGTSATRSIHRGLLVYTNLLCNQIGAPPANATQVTAQFMRTPTMTDRDYITQLTMSSGTVCVGCHGKFGQSGFAFDAYDMNAQATQTPGDLSGALDGVSFNGPNDLQQKLLGPKLESCAAKKWLSFALDRQPEMDDLNSVEAGTQSLLTGTGQLDLRALVAQIASVDAFRSRRFAP